MIKFGLMKFINEEIDKIIVDEKENLGKLVIIE